MIERAARARWADDHWNVQLNYTRRDAPRQLSLATGRNLALDSRRLGLEAQTHWRLAGDRLPSRSVKPASSASRTTISLTGPLQNAAGKSARAFAICSAA